MESREQQRARILAILNPPAPPEEIFITGDGYIDIETWKGLQFYSIELNRIEDDSAILHWVNQLCGKNWMTVWKINKFIEKMQIYNKTVKESEGIKCLS